MPYDPLVGAKPRSRHDFAATAAHVPGDEVAVPGPGGHRGRAVGGEERVDRRCGQRQPHGPRRQGLGECRPAERCDLDTGDGRDDVGGIQRTESGDVAPYYLEWVRRQLEEHFGKSLYDENSTGGRARKVSFDRPYKDAQGTGALFRGDFQLITWLEKNGYDVTYATSDDTHAQPGLPNNHKVLVSGFHDEMLDL